jgi:hypothetical protein
MANEGDNDGMGEGTPDGIAEEDDEFKPPTPFPNGIGEEVCDEGAVPLVELAPLVGGRGNARIAPPGVVLDPGDGPG